MRRRANATSKTCAFKNRVFFSLQRPSYTASVIIDFVVCRSHDSVFGMTTFDIIRSKVMITSINPTIERIFARWIYRNAKLLKLYHSLIINTFPSNDENQKKNQNARLPDFYAYLILCPNNRNEICWLSNNQFERKAKKTTLCCLHKNDNSFTQEKIDISTFLLMI